MSDRIVTVFSGGGTGGHLYPALALAGALKRIRPDVRPFFIGAERGIEARVLPEHGVEHLLVAVEGGRRGGDIAGNLKVLAQLAKAVTRVAGLFRRLRPRLVVVTGGYAGGPAGIVAVLTRTRLVLQEQNSLPGITTRFLSVFASEVHLAFPEAVASLPRRSRLRARVTGNPVLPPTTIDRAAAAAAFGLDPSRPVVLVVGGSQGSEALNEGILGAVTAVIQGGVSGPDDLQLLWATGLTHLERIQDTLLKEGNPSWVHAVGYIQEMPQALALASIAVSRAGAMATSEFLAWGIPSILVPLPTAAADHQTRNAEALQEAGAALYFTQKEMTGEVLWGAVQGLLSRPAERERMARAARARGRPEAVLEIARSLEALLPPPMPTPPTPLSGLRSVHGSVSAPGGGRPK